MTFTVKEFEDLVTIIEQQPEWRRRLVTALFPEIDVAKALKDIADTNKILREMLERMDARQDRLEQGQARLEQDVEKLQQGQTRLEQDVEKLQQGQDRLEQSVDTLKRDIGGLKGDSLERKYRDGATGLFGLYLRNGHDATNQVADQLYAAVRTGTISDTDLTQVLAADLLWGGESRESKELLILVMEASWLVEEHDVERAAARSTILRQIGMNSLAVVGGKDWTTNAVLLAEKLHVVTTTNGRINRASWDAAMSMSL